MKQEKRDRRSQRTRHLVQDALVALLREKRYDAITVQDLLERAGIGRSTFSTHYFDKEDVLAAVAEEQLALLRQQLSHRQTGQAIIPGLELFQHVQANLPLFQAMVRGHAGKCRGKQDRSY